MCVMTIYPHVRRACVLATVLAVLVGLTVTLLVGVDASAARAAAGGSLNGKRTKSTGGTVSLVAYSTPKPAYTVLIKDFQSTSAGHGVTFTQAYGPSGTEATAVIEGLHATVVNFSLEPDMEKLVKAGLVSATWDKGPTDGIVTDSVVAFIVRKGNPKHITNWADLLKPGVGIITPNPFSSGSARWNILAAYGSELALGKTKTQAVSYLQSLLKHAIAQPTSASTALETFLSGEGTVVLDYEDDALYAQRKGEPVTVIVPAQNILIQNPIAVTTKASDPAAAKAFVSYLESPAGQTIWAEQGYRPVLATVAKKFHFPQPTSLFTITTLGGWTKVVKTFFTPTSGIVTKIEEGLGVSTAKG
jgi:sulfate/thiosulfate transport system substrate-binding protein